MKILLFLALAAGRPVDWGNCTHPWPQAMDAWTAFSTSRQEFSFAFVAGPDRILIDAFSGDDNRLEVVLACGSPADAFVREAVRRVTSALPDVCGKDVLVGGDVLDVVHAPLLEHLENICAVPGPKIIDVRVLEREVRIRFDRHIGLVRAGAAAFREYSSLRFTREDLGHSVIPHRL